MKTTLQDDDNDLSLALLFTGGATVTPDASVWAAIEGALDRDQAHVDYMAKGIWAPTATGVLTKLLWDGRSLLITCEAGAIIPEHEHFAEERIMVISGDMIIDGFSYRSGDALTLAKGTHHGQTTTKTGCVILISYVN